MTIQVKKEGNKLLIKTGGGINSSLSNKEVLKTAIANLNQKNKEVVIVSDYLIKTYKADLLQGLKELDTTDPVSDYLTGKKELENTKIILKAKEHMKKGVNSTEIYNQLFTPKIKPAFIKSIVNNRTPSGFKKLREYKLGDSKVLILTKGNQSFYHLKPSENNLSYDDIKTVASTLKDISSRELDLSNLRENVKELIKKKDCSEELKEVIKRHSIGFGILDIIFRDENRKDVYFYSSSKNIHITHSVYGDCETNLKLSEKDIEAIGTKIRVASGRPFDDSFPVIDYELEEYNLRVCGVREPLTFNGVGFAFRKHRNIPWNLSSFVENGMISSEVAGLLNFLVDGQCSILITGPRGSGKTSILASLINEVPISQRIIIIEDTPELPVNKLSENGFRIQHLRVKPPLKDRSTDYELSAEEALRTALRLGESVLVIGEVRGEEAKALFEAMRVGAAGNVVLGTIHGSSVYDTFDRVVNDLGVPPTSFKSTDIIISCASLRRGESLSTDRRVVSITEVQKNWTKEPVFKELTIFDRKTKRIKLSPKIKDSAVIKKIAALKGMTVKQCLDSIKTRGKAKELLVKLGYSKKVAKAREFNNKMIELLAKRKRNTLSELRKFLSSAKKN